MTIIRKTLWTTLLTSIFATPSWGNDNHTRPFYAAVAALYTSAIDARVPAATNGSGPDTRAPEWNDTSLKLGLDDNGTSLISLSATGIRVEVKF